MTQRTVVVQVPPDRAAALERRLRAGSFQWRAVPHARFSVKGEGAVATLYASGKLVVQGSDPELFLARHTDLEVAVPAPPATAADELPLLRIDEATVGSDETGKGDYFGPLVVAAARVEPEEARELVAAGVADSKRLTDARALQLAVALRKRLPHAVRSLSPEEYNATYARGRGLNPLLAELHAAAIAEVAQPGDRVVVDQFAHASVMLAALDGRDVRLEQAFRAERNVAVAAASILARAEFLLALRELSERWGIELHKGAGLPTDEAGVRFAKKHGAAALARVAKVHFKNTAKIRARLGRLG